MKDIYLESISSEIAIRQQAITWANVDLDLCLNMASLGHNELTNDAVLASWILHQKS